MHYFFQLRTLFFLLKYPQLHSQEENAKDFLANEKYLQAPTDIQASTDLRAPKELQHEAPKDLQAPKVLDSAAGDKSKKRTRSEAA